MTALLALLLCTASAQEAEPAEAFMVANQAFDAGAFSEAAEGYSALVDRGVDTAGVYYNLGNAMLRQGEVGPAIAAYLEARARAPRDGDLLANLAFARSTTKDAIEPPDVSSVARTLLFWHFVLGTTERAVALVVLNALFWGLAARRLWRRDSEAARWGLPLLAVLLVALLGSAVVRAVAPTRVAVVLVDETAARAGHADDAVLRFELHAGTEARVVEEREDWVRVELADGEQGWLPGADVQIVEVW